MMMLPDSELAKLKQAGLRVVRWERYIGVIREWQPGGWQVIERSTSAGKMQRVFGRIRKDPKTIVVGG